MEPMSRDTRPPHRGRAQGNTPGRRHGWLGVPLFRPQGIDPPPAPAAKGLLHNPFNANVKLSRGEMARIGKVMAERLNAAKGFTQVLVPTKGWSIYGSRGGPLYDPGGNSALLKALRDNLQAHIGLETLDVHINDPQVCRCMRPRFAEFFRKESVMKTEKVEIYRQELSFYSQRAFNRGLVSGTGGNLSVRIPGTDTVLVTPTGISLGDVAPDENLLFNLDGDVLDSPKGLKGSKETSFHLAAYRQRPETGAIAHVHPPYATAYSISGKPLPW